MNDTYFVSWSTGKDCSYALYLFKQQHPEARFHLLHMARSSETRAHRLSHRLIEDQAAAMGLSLSMFPVEEGDVYAQRFQEALAEMKQRGITQGIFGDIYLEVHREWLLAECEKAGITPHFPLWGKCVTELYRGFVEAGFRSRIIAVAQGYHALLGCYLDAELEEKMQQYPHADLCGENGEYHSLVVDGPLFTRELSYRIVGQYQTEKLMGYELDCPLRLVLIRHGETVENTQHICQGQTRGTLNDKGIAQAQALAAELATMRPHAIYSSDLQRARQSAELIFPDSEIRDEQRLRERSFGALEGSPLPSGVAFDDDIEGAETLCSLVARVDDFLHTLRAEHAGELVVLVSHGVVIKTLLHLVTGESFDSIAIPKNCQPFHLEL